MSGTAPAATEKPAAAAATPPAGAAPAAAATPAPTAAPTALNGTDTTTAAPGPATWPDDWRQRIAGEDPKVLKRMERFSDPGAVWKSYTAMEQKLSSGELKAAPPGADAKPEEIAAWRKDNGIPEKPEGYLDNLPDKLVVGDAEKPLVQVFAAAMHAQNAPPSVVHAAIKSYQQVQQSALADRADKDAQAQSSTEDELRTEWGADYRRNINAVVGWVRSTFGDAADMVLSARLPDGTPLASNPKTIRGMLANALELNPAATVVPGAGQSAGKGIDERIAEIDKMMKTDMKAYRADPKVRQEYRDLLDAKERMKGRAA